MQGMLLQISLGILDKIFWDINMNQAIISILFQNNYQLLHGYTYVHKVKGWKNILENEIKYRWLEAPELPIYSSTVNPSKTSIS